MKSTHILTFHPLVFVLFLPLGFTTQAASVSIGLSQSEQTSFVQDRQLDFVPQGITAFVSHDFTEKLSVSVNHTHLQDDKSLAKLIAGKVDIKSWQLGVQYYWDDWSISASFSDWQDSLNIQSTQSTRLTIEQQTESPSTSLSLTRDWSYGDWHLALTSGVHVNQWRHRSYRDATNLTAQSEVNKGTSTFVSVTASASRLINLSNSSFVIVGSGLSWNQLTRSESSLVSRNGRNISQITNRTRGTTINLQSVTGSESYGQLNAYLSYNLSKNWIVDADISYDFGGETNSLAYAISVGYLFNE